MARKVVEKQRHLKVSRNNYDWLGSGIYFWESDPTRAFEWARELKRRGKVQRPAVVGAVIDLGECLNLLDREHLKLLKDSYDNLVASSAIANRPLPENKPVQGSAGLFYRNLDCATVNLCTQMRRQRSKPPFDTVRAAFIEGEPLYRDAGFCDRNHIQVCVCNPNCIKGYFRPIKAKLT